MRQLLVKLLSKATDLDRMAVGERLGAPNPPVSFQHARSLMAQRTSPEVLVTDTANTYLHSKFCVTMSSCFVGSSSFDNRQQSTVRGNFRLWSP